MSLRRKQSEFTKNVAKLIDYATKKGYELTFGEAFRTEYQQRHYINIGRSWTMRSQHLKRLAVDFNLFKAGVYLTNSMAYKELGKYWEQLSKYNVWGGRFHDGNHFEMRHDFPRKSLRNGKYKNDL